MEGIKSQFGAAGTLLAATLALGSAGCRAIDDTLGLLDVRNDTGETTMTVMSSGEEFVTDTETLAMLGIDTSNVLCAETCWNHVPIVACNDKGCSDDGSLAWKGARPYYEMSQEGWCNFLASFAPYCDRPPMDFEWCDYDDAVDVGFNAPDDTGRSAIYCVVDF